MHIVAVFLIIVLVLVVVLIVVLAVLVAILIVVLIVVLILVLVVVLIVILIVRHLSLLLFVVFSYNSSMSESIKKYTELIQLKIICARRRQETLSKLSQATPSE